MSSATNDYEMVEMSNTYSVPESQSQQKENHPTVTLKK